MMSQSKSMLVVLLVGAALSVCAAPPNDSFTVFIVDTVVEDSCLVSSQNVSFGSFNPLLPLGPMNGQTSAPIYVTCTYTTPYSIHLTEGQNGAFLARGMTGAATGNFINYQMYIDNKYTTVWGNGTSGTGYNGGIGTGWTQTHVAHGQITLGGAAVMADSYTDTIQVDVIY